ncbi:MAG: acyltransferase [Pseudolysinimonas sp.]
MTSSVSAPASAGIAAPPPRLEALTGMRIIAAIVVFNAHLTANIASPDWLKDVTLGGHDWMTMFFMLSGLVLTWNYDRLLGDRITRAGLRTYVVARSARIYPLYLLTLLLTAAASIGSLHAIAATIKNGTFWLNVFALQTWSGDLTVAYSYNSPSWSIGVEFLLYALLPLLLFAFRPIRRNLRALIMVAAAAVLVIVVLTAVLTAVGAAALPHTDPLSAHRLLYRTPVTRVADFVVGISLAYILKLVPSAGLERFGRWAQVVGGIVVLVVMSIPAITFTAWSYDALMMVPWAFIFLGLVWAPRTVLARFLATPVTVLLGESSYAFYLLHQFIVAFSPRAGTGVVGLWITWAIALLLTGFLAVGVHLLFEQPVRGLLRKWLDPHPPTRTSEPELPSPATV